MTEKTTYIAADGKEFEDKIECLAYEETYTKVYQVVFDNFDFYDQDLEPIEVISVEDLKEKGYDICNRADYIYAKKTTEDVLQAFEDFGDIYGIVMSINNTVPSDINFYHFQEGSYYSADEEIYEKLAFLRRLKEKGMDISL